MKKHITLLFLLFLAPLALSAQQTVYVIDNVSVDKFDGSQLKGKTIRDYQITTTGSGRKAVTVHSITTGPTIISGTLSKEDMERLRRQTEIIQLRADSLVQSGEIMRLRGAGQYRYVIDGTTVDDGSALRSIAPGDVAGITVLSRADSKKKYDFDGTVIEVTTRKNPDIEKLLDKMPGVKLSKDGSITVNGEKVSKITINGKTYKLD
ncbi:MAG: hypothetical protein IJK55_00025 [Bacteroidales bacterium]|nr:hypothetical protein [Bacteroidales bacterium]